MVPTINRMNGLMLNSNKVPPAPRNKTAQKFIMPLVASGNVEQGPAIAPPTGCRGGQSRSFAFPDVGSLRNDDEED